MIIFEKSTQPMDELSGMNWSTARSVRLACPSPSVLAQRPLNGTRRARFDWLMLYFSLSRSYARLVVPERLPLNEGSGFGHTGALT